MKKQKKSVVISLWRSLVLLQVVMLFSFCIHSYTIFPDTEKHFFTMIDKESVSCYTLCLRVLRVLRVFRDLHAVCFDFSSANPAMRSVSLQTVCPHLKSMCYSRTIKYNKSVPYVGTQCQQLYITAAFSEEEQLCPFKRSSPEMKDTAGFVFMDTVRCGLDFPCGPSAFRVPPGTSASTLQ